MHTNPRTFRLTAAVAVSALLWDAVLPVVALGQPAPPPLPPAQGQPDQNQGDPPARVGRVANITGAVSFHNRGDTQWSPISVNYPVSTGNAFWTEPSAATALEISDSRVALAGGTEFDIYALDASGLQGVAAQGETYIRLRNLAPNEVWSVQTPRGLVRLSGEGRYGIAVGTVDQPTMITVVEGAAQIEGPGVSLQVGANQTATISGTDTFQGTVGPAIRDAFLTERLNAERPPPPRAGVPVQVAAMPGGDALYGSGNWSEAPEYGQVWYPPVSPGWVPYRQGHWAYVAPWGWTWIDDASWGFAPFHYGRWLQVGDRWAWTPGGVAVAEPPVYAPALVAFIGIGAGVALGAALASGSIGWVPLGPREPFRPWYHASDRYVREVNVSHVTNMTNNNVTINNYVNRGGATSVPAAVMMGSRPVQAAAQPLTSQQFAAARPIVGQQPLRPTAATLGVTPVVARQLNLGPTAAPRLAPGPEVRALGPGSGGFARPGLVATGRPVPANPIGQPVPGRAPTAAVPNQPGAPAPGIRPIPGGGPTATQPNRPEAPGAPPPAAGAPNAFQPNRAPGLPPPQAGRAATEPHAIHPGEPGPGGRAPATVARPVPTQVAPAGAPPPPAGTPNAVQPNRQTGLPGSQAGRLAAEPQVIHPAVPRPVPQQFAPAVAPHPAPPVAPPPRPEPRFVAPPAPAPHPEARPEPAAHPAPPPQAHAAPPGRLEPPAREKKPGDH